jgi:hypothetical protein
MESEKSSETLASYLITKWSLYPEDLDLLCECRVRLPMCVCVQIWLQSKFTNFLKNRLIVTIDTCEKI